MNTNLIPTVIITAEQALAQQNQILIKENQLKTNNEISLWNALQAANGQYQNQ